ncbi:hypothetical protein F2P81_002557 [Scophthalmus maximus]|uniref:Uncharacterized protein n=1 Tax=Scophthalmus maximus TaxID=52904 RepID=A0A6A4TNS3_SCOMX|nr:hypothetical protein F2P81_002557 [Scophthalmus maximus]
MRLDDMSRELASSVKGHPSLSSPAKQYNEDAMIFKSSCKHKAAKRRTTENSPGSAVPQSNFQICCIQLLLPY